MKISIVMIIFLEISIIKETINTTTTTMIEKDYKKDKNDVGHIMISYNHSTQALCLKIAKALRVGKRFMR